MVMDWEDDSSIIHTNMMHELQGAKGEPLRSTQGIEPNVLLGATSIVVSCHHRGVGVSAGQSNECFFSNTLQSV
jgi:hypothetical protein